MTTQVSAQVTKPATKAAAKAKTVPAKAKAATKAKAAAKPKAAAASAVKFALVDRPVSGNRLYAFTQAVQELFGMDKGKAVPRAEFAKVVGATAINYHKGKGTYAVDDKGMVTITAAGKASFANRAARIDPALVEAYKAVLTTGKPSDAVCKNADLILKLA